MTERARQNLNSAATVAFCVALTWAIAASIRHDLVAQKAERGTQQWEINVDDLASFKVNKFRLHVIDTTGVCLYLARDTSGTSAAVGITAVSKTSLPAGTGCQ